MSPSRALTLLLLLAGPGAAQGIVPQTEPDEVVACAAQPQPRDLCLGPSLDPADRQLLAEAHGGTVLPFRAPLWTPDRREYKLVAPGRTLYVTLVRGGTGPWQVTRVTRNADPRAYVPAGQLTGTAPVTVRASGFMPGARVQARVALPNGRPGPVLAESTARPDGTALLNFEMPGTVVQVERKLPSAGSGTLTEPAQERLITETELVVHLGTPGGQRAVTAALPYRARLRPTDLRARYEGQIHFRYLPGQMIRARDGEVEVLEVHALDAVTALRARRFPRAPTGPADQNAYVRRLLELHPDALSPYGGEVLAVEGHVDTPSGPAWRLLLTGDFGSRPLYVLFTEGALWTLQGNAAHSAFVDAAVQTLHLPAR